jgi:hypothetical protein
VEDLTPRAFPARAQVQVWQDGSVRLLHGLRLESDRLDGVPFTQAPTCDSCRVHLALGVVDSLRIGSKERGFFRPVRLQPECQGRCSRCSQESAPRKAGSAGLAG